MRLWRRRKIPVYGLGVTRLHPDDVLVLQCRQMITREEAENIQQQFQDNFPDNKVLVLSDPLKLDVVKPCPTSKPQPKESQ